MIAPPGRTHGWHTIRLDSCTKEKYDSKQSILEIKARFNDLRQLSVKNHAISPAVTAATAAGATGGGSSDRTSGGAGSSRVPPKRKRRASFSACVDSQSNAGAAATASPGVATTTTTTATTATTANTATTAVAAAAPAAAANVTTIGEIPLSNIRDGDSDAHNVSNDIPTHASWHNDAIIIVYSLKGVGVWGGDTNLLSVCLVNACLLKRPCPEINLYYGRLQA